MQDIIVNPKTSFIQECLYSEYRRYVREAVEGEVVTRLQIAPCRYLNIGDAKPACINYHYANMYKGEMVLRIDDADPTLKVRSSNDALLEDLASIDIYPSKITFVSNYFDTLVEKLTWLIENSLAYCDSTSQEERERM